MKLPFIYSLVLLLSLSFGNNTNGQAHRATRPKQPASVMQLWLTKSDKTVLFERQKQAPVFGSVEKGNVTIEVNDGQHFQTMDGFGFCLTGGSAMLLSKMNAASRS